MNWVDYTIIIIIIIGIFSGMSKGFVMSVSSILCIVASMIIAKMYYKPVSLFLMKYTGIDEKIMDFLSKNDVTKGLPSNMAVESIKILSNQDLSSHINSFLMLALMNVISVLFIFICARLVFYVIEAFFKDLVKLPGLKELNMIGGGTLGLAKSLLLLLLVFAVLVPVSNVIQMNNISKGIQGSMLAQYFYTYNFVLTWIWTTAFDLLKL